MLANDSDPEGDVYPDLTAAVVATTSNGTLVLNADGSFDYSHNDTVTSGDTFTYNITDSAGNISNTATVNLYINPRPTANDISAPVICQQSGTINVAAVSGAISNDTDPEGQALTAALVSGPANASSFTLNADGSYDYTHDGTATSGDSFTYNAVDIYGGVSAASGTVSITINLAPLAENISIPTIVQQSGTINIPAVSGVLSNDSDPEGAGLTAAVVSGPSNSSSFTLNADGSFDYTHDGTATSGDSFVYSATDVNGASDNAICSLTINLAPNANDIAISTIVQQSGTINIPAVSGVLSNDTDPEGQALTASLVSGPSNSSSFTLNADGSFDYTHDGTHTSGDSFVYTTTDAQGGTDNANCTITINLAPSGNNITAPLVQQSGTINVPAVSGVLSNDVDPEGQALTASVAVAPANSSSFTLNADGSYDYTHDGTATSGDSFTYTVTDSQGGFDTAVCDITINLWPTAIADTAPIVCASGGTINIPSNSGVLVNDSDPEGQPLTATVLASPANASAFTLYSNGAYDYTHDGTATSGDFFTYTCSDGNGGTDTARCDITIDLTPSGGGAPTASGDTASVDNDTITQGSVLIDVLANDTDPSELPLTINSFTQPTSGTVDQVGQELRYTADAGFHGSDTFYYDCTNGSEVSNSGQVDVTVNLVSRTVLIGSTGDYVDWEAWCQSNSGQYAYDAPSEAGALPLTVVFQSGETHSGTRFTHDYFQGTWDDIATELTVTSQGFTGKPYGTPGGNGTYFYHPYGDRGFNHGSNANSFGKITWREIEIDAPSTNGTNHGLFYFRFCPSLDFTVDRCLLHGMNNTQSLCGLFYCREDHGEIKITNNLVYNLTASGASVGAFLAVNPATETDNEIRVYNNTVYDCAVNNVDSSLIRILNTNKVQLYNNVLTCSGTRPATLARRSIEPSSGVREFIFNDVNPDTITASGSTPGSFITDGFASGMNVIVNGTSSNDGTYKIKTVAATTLTLESPESLTTEGPIGTGITLSAGTFINTNSSGNVIDDNSGSDNDIFNIVIQSSSGTSDVYVNTDLTGGSELDLTHKSTSPAVNVALPLTIGSGIGVGEITNPALDFVDRNAADANWNAGATTSVASGEAMTMAPWADTWARYDQILDEEPSGTLLMSRKEFRDGFGAVIHDNTDTINMTASRVDDNGVLRIIGGVTSGNYDINVQDEMMTFLRSLKHQTHVKAVGSSATEYVSPSGNIFGIISDQINTNSPAPKNSSTFAAVSEMICYPTTDSLFIEQGIEGDSKLVARGNLQYRRRLSPPSGPWKTTLGMHRVHPTYGIGSTDGTKYWNTLNGMISNLAPDTEYEIKIDVTVQSSPISGESSADGVGITFVDDITDYFMCTADLENPVDQNNTDTINVSRLSSIDQEGFRPFVSGMIVTVTNSSSNDGNYEIDSVTYETPTPIVASAGRTLTFAASGNTITADGGNFIADGVKPGMSVTVTGTTNNNDTYAVSSVTSGVIDCVNSPAMTDEGPLSSSATLTPFGTSMTVSSGTLTSEGPSFSAQIQGTLTPSGTASYEMTAKTKALPREGIGVIIAEGIDTSREFTFTDSLGATPDTITCPSGSFITDGFASGNLLTVLGTANNNGQYTINAVTAGTLTLDSGDSLVNEGPIGSGVVLGAKNVWNVYNRAELDTVLADSANVASGDIIIMHEDDRVATQVQASASRILNFKQAAKVQASATNTITFTSGTNEVTRSDGGSFIDDGYVSGMQLRVCGQNGFYATPNRRITLVEGGGSNDTIRISAGDVLADGWEIGMGITLDGMGNDKVVTIDSVASSGSNQASGITGSQEFSFATNETITSNDNFNFLDNGFIKGMQIIVDGSASNDGRYVLSNVTSGVLTVDRYQSSIAGDDLTTENNVGNGLTINGSCQIITLDAGDDISDQGPENGGENRNGSMCAKVDNIGWYDITAVTASGITVGSAFTNETNSKICTLETGGLVEASGASPGDFVADGFIEGMSLEVNGTASNDGRYTIANVSTTKLGMIGSFTDQMTEELNVTSTATLDGNGAAYYTDPTGYNPGANGFGQGNSNFNQSITISLVGGTADNPLIIRGNGDVRTPRWVVDNDWIWFDNIKFEPVVRNQIDDTAYYNIVTIPAIGGGLSHDGIMMTRCELSWDKCQTYDLNGKGIENVKDGYWHDSALQVGSSDNDIVSHLYISDFTVGATVQNGIDNTPDTTDNFNNKPSNTGWMIREGFEIRSTAGTMIYSTFFNTMDAWSAGGTGAANEGEACGNDFWNIKTVQHYDDIFETDYTGWGNHMREQRHSKYRVQERLPLGHPSASSTRSSLDGISVWSLGQGGTWTFGNYQSYIQGTGISVKADDNTLMKIRAPFDATSLSSAHSHVWWNRGQEESASIYQVPGQSNGLCWAGNYWGARRNLAGSDTFGDTLFQSTGGSALGGVMKGEIWWDKNSYYELWGDVEYSGPGSRQGYPGTSISATSDTWSQQRDVKVDANSVEDLNIRSERSAETSSDDTLSFNNANPDTITRSTGSFVTDGYSAGMTVTVLGSASNDGTYTVAAGGVAATTLTLENTDSLTAESSVGNATASASGSRTFTFVSVFGDGVDYVECSGGNFITDGFKAGQYLTVTGVGSKDNNGEYRIANVTASGIELNTYDRFINEGPLDGSTANTCTLTGKTIVKGEKQVTSVLLNPPPMPVDVKKTPHEQLGNTPYNNIRSYWETEFNDGAKGTMDLIKANTAGTMYGAGVQDSDFDGAEMFLNPYLDNAVDSGIINKLSLPTKSARDIGPGDTAMGDYPVGTRSYTDYLAYQLPEGWEVKGSIPAGLGIVSGSGQQRIVVGRTDNTVAVLVEFEPGDNPYNGIWTAPPSGGGSGEALTGTWGRYEEILTIEASGTEVIERKEFRDGLGAVVNDNGANINLSAARVDDNGVLRVTGGCASGDWNMTQLEDWMEVVHGLWSQTHFRTRNSNLQEPAVNQLSSNSGEAGSETWGFVGKTWTGAPTDDFGFQYAYTVDSGNNLITLTDFPTLTRWDTTEFREFIQFETDGASIPPNDQSFVTGTTYSTTNYSSGPNGTFNVESADWTGEGTASGRFINTAFGVETYLVELLGNVTYETCNFILHTRGDYDQRTTAEVRFRRTGTETWTQTISARQARGHQSWDNYRFNISSTIQRLTPNTEYDLQLTLSNPSGIYADGVSQGTSYVTSTTFRTRQRPVLPASGTVHTPTNLTEIRELLGCAGAGGTPASAGDTILLPSGDFSDKDGTNKLEDISIAGTELNPIYIFGSGNVTELPRLDFTNQSAGVNWLIFDNFRIKNWGGDMASTNNYYAVSGPNGTNGNTHGIVFTRLDIQNPEIQDGDIHGFAESGERYDKQGGFFTGGNNGEDHKWWNIEDCNIHLGYYPETPLSGLHNTWQPHEGFDLRTTSTVIQFNDFRNMYENSFTHTGGDGGGNLALHNEVHHNTFYAITDDWIESDESDGGHIIHDNIVNHGVNWFNTNLEGLVPACIGGAGQSGWHYTAYPKYYGDYTISNSGVTNGYKSWDISNTGASISYNSTTSVQQRTYQQYTLSGGDTFNITNHGYVNDDRVVFIGRQDVTIPSGLTKESYSLSSNQTTGNRPEAVTEYYVVNSNANDFQVSTTQGGAAVSGITDSASASGRYVGGPNRDLWVASQDWATNSAKITTRMSGSYPTRTEYHNAHGPDDDFPVLIDNARRTSIAFSGYRIFSLQDNIGGVPHWLVNNQCTGNMLFGSSDGVLKIKVDGASLNMLGQVIHCQYQWYRSDRMEKNASQYWTNCMYFQQSNGYFSTSNYAIGGGPTAGTTGSPIATRYTYWDRNSWFNADVSRNLLGQSSVPNMFTAYLIDENSHEILTPVSGDVLNFWAESDSPEMTPEPGNFWDSDYGTKQNLYANQEGDLYGSGSTNADLPGVDHIQGPYITAADSANVNFMVTKTEDRRDIGPNQAGLPTPRGARSYADFLSYVLPDGWEVKASGSDYSNLGVHPGSGVERLIIGKTDNSAAILIEHEEVDETYNN